MMSIYNLCDSCFNYGSVILRSAGFRRVSLRARFPHALAATIFLLAFSYGENLRAEQKGIKRISSINKNLGEVRKIYLHAGLVSTLEFKQSVIGVKVGNIDSIKAEISPSNPKEVTLRLKHQSAEPTNMIVRVDRHVYVFDLIPSKASHQDYVKIEGSFGAPTREALQSPKERSKIHPESKQQPRLLESVRLGVGE